jgi:hypothetical protein
MSNRLALALGGILLAAFLADRGLNDGEGGLFLMRRFLGLVDFLTFWR